MAGGVRLVEALTAVAARYAPADRAAKLELLDALGRTVLRAAPSLRRLHEALCFLQAHPDDVEVLAGVDRELARFPERVARLSPAARARLHDSGIAGTALDYPLGYPMAAWLARRFGADAEIAWAKFDEADRLDETLSLLASAAEGDAFSEGGIGWRAWLSVAKGGRPMTDLELLLELFERAPLPEETREWLFENLSLPIRWTLRDSGASRTLARMSTTRVFFHRAGIERRPGPLEEALTGPLPTLRRAPRPLADALIEAARVAMVTRQRELHAFSHPNPDDVLLAHLDRGLTIALFGLAPGFRLPLEGYYAFLALKNGVPVSYGGGWALFGTLDFAINIFPSFRQGESALLARELLRVYRRIFGMHTIVVDRYQLGHESTEALQSGSFYFYHRLGFRPRRPDIVAVLDQERAKLGADPSYRSPLPVLRRLAGDEVYLVLPGGHAEPEQRVRATDVSALVARLIAREFSGDRRRATHECARRVGHLLGVRAWRSWPPAEREAFARLSLVVALLPDLASWRGPERSALVDVLRAKGGSSERGYTRMLDRHRRFRLGLEALVRSAR